MSPGAPARAFQSHSRRCGDAMVDVVQSTRPLLHSEDMLVISEKVVSITQQSHPISQIEPSWLARVLAVRASRHGIGLGVRGRWARHREAGPLRHALPPWQGLLLWRRGCSTGYAAPALLQSTDRATILTLQPLRDPWPFGARRSGGIG